MTVFRLSGSLQPVCTSYRHRDFQFVDVAKIRWDNKGDFPRISGFPIMSFVLALSTTHLSLGSSLISFMLLDSDCMFPLKNYVIFFNLKTSSFCRYWLKAVGFSFAEGALSKSSVHKRILFICSDGALSSEVTKKIALKDSSLICSELRTSWHKSYLMISKV